MVQTGISSRGEVLEELVLLQDLLLAPAPRPVELGHHPGAVRQLHLVDPVLERVEGIADGVAPQAPGLDGGQHLLGGQGEEEVGFGRGVVLHAANVAKTEAGRSCPAPGFGGQLALVTTSENRKLKLVTWVHVTPSAET